MRSFPMRPVKTTMRKQSGIALITTLLLLLLMSAMVVGFMLLVTEGQRLSGMNNEQSRAFYGAESGMEKLTADLGSLFGTTYAPSGAQVDVLERRPRFSLTAPAFHTSMFSAPVRTPSPIPRTPKATPRLSLPRSS